MKERTLKRASTDIDVTDEHYLGRFSGNPHSAKNVNAPQGPRTGNPGAHAAKRGNFKDEKASRQPLADFVTSAFDHRAAELEANPGEHEVPGEGSIDANSQVKRFKARKSKYKD
jgi:hypothetical protein